MIKNILEIEFKKTGERYYFTSYLGIFANFTPEEVGTTMRQIYFLPKNELGECETSTIYIRNVLLGGKADIIRRNRDAEPKYSYAQIMQLRPKRRYVSPADGLTYGLNELAKLNPCEGSPLIGYEGDVLVYLVDIPTLCERGLRKAIAQRMINLGWRFEYISGKIEAYFSYELK